MSTLDGVDKNEKTIQQQKLTEFMRYVKESLKTHFKQWANELFFLGLFSNQHTATEVAKIIFGRSVVGNGREVYAYLHKRTIDTSLFFSFLTENVSMESLMVTRSLSVVANNPIVLSILADGQDLWAKQTPSILTNFRMIYLKEYLSLPTNTQFTERGVKESGYVTLGRRGEVQRSILAISRGKFLKEALQAGRSDINKANNEENRKQLQGKKKTKALIRGI